MERNFDIITFDCHGTLIDRESGIANAFLSAALSLGYFS
jgi:phosphoglycolate phosphatase-like HAD superfamily hydrolase